jgi:hypothetical protein
MRLIHTKPLKYILPELSADSLEDYTAGQANMLLLKTAGTPSTTHSLAGKLYLSSTGWLLLSVPNALVRGAFDALDEPGAELPLRDGILAAHITVMSSEDVSKIGGADKITERGHQFRYTLGPVQEVKPKGQKDLSKVWFIKILSKELQDLRKSYGLSPKPEDGDHDFHITVAVRKTKVLQDNEVAKAAMLTDLPALVGLKTIVHNQTTQHVHPQIDPLDMAALNDNSAISTLRQLPVDTDSLIRGKKRKSLRLVPIKNPTLGPVVQQILEKESDHYGMWKMQEEATDTNSSSSECTKEADTEDTSEQDFECEPKHLDGIYKYYDTQSDRTTDDGDTDAGTSEEQGIKEAGPISYVTDKVHKVYKKLTHRYGPTMAKVIVGSGAVGLPLPIPGASLMTAAPAMAVGEVLRAIDHPIDREEQKKVKKADTVEDEDEDKKHKRNQLLTSLGVPLAAGGAALGLAANTSADGVPMQVTKFVGQNEPSVIRGRIGPGAPASTIENTGDAYISAGGTDAWNRSHLPISDQRDLVPGIKQILGNKRLGVLDIEGHGAWTHQNLGLSQTGADEKSISPKTVEGLAEGLKTIPKGQDPQMYMYGCNTGLCAVPPGGKPQHNWLKYLSDNSGMTAWGGRGYVTSNSSSLDQSVHGNAYGAYHQIEPGPNNIAGEDNTFTKYEPGKAPKRVVTQTDDTPSKRTFGALPSSKLTSLLYGIGKPSAITGAIAAPLIGSERAARNTALATSGLALPMALSEIYARISESSGRHQLGLNDSLGSVLKNQAKALPYVGLAALPLLSYGAAHALGRWKKKDDKQTGNSGSNIQEIQQTPTDTREDKAIH